MLNSLGKGLVSKVLPFVLATKFLFGGLASADPAKGWNYCYEDGPRPGNYGVVVEGEKYDVKLVKDTPDFNPNTIRAWHVETPEGEVIGDDRHETGLYKRVATAAQVAYIEDKAAQDLIKKLREDAEAYRQAIPAQRIINIADLGLKLGSKLEGVLIGAKVGGVNMGATEIKNVFAKETANYLKHQL